MPLLTPAIMLLLLTGPWAIAGAAARRRGKPFDPAPSAALGLALMFVFTGLGHFTRTESMAGMLPAWIPGRTGIVIGTGVLELGLAVALLFPGTRRGAALAAIAFFAASFPANVHAAFERHPMGGGDWGPAYLLLRAPLQAFLIYWAWRFVLPPRPPTSPSG